MVLLLVFIICNCACVRVFGHVCTRERRCVFVKRVCLCAVHVFVHADMCISMNSWSLGLNIKSVNYHTGVKVTYCLLTYFENKKQIKS